MAGLILEFFATMLFQLFFDGLTWIIVARSSPPVRASHYQAIITRKRRCASSGGKNREMFFCTFATDSGDQELAVTPRDYAHLSEWQTGMLTTVNGAFRSFRPTGEMDLPQIVDYLKKAAEAPTQVA